MSSVGELKAQRSMEAETKKSATEIKQAKLQLDREYTGIVKKKESELVRMQNDYDSRLSRLKNDQERKLQEIREKNNLVLGEEDQRLKDELKNLKSVHREQVEEIKIGQGNEIEQLTQSHQRTVDQARERFMKEKSKWNA